MATREVTLTISFRKPWWTYIAFGAAKALCRLGVPINTERFSRWLVGHFKIKTELN